MWQALTKQVPSEELERAKAAAVSAILVNLESRAVANEDIGRQILTYGHRCGRCCCKAMHNDRYATRLWLCIRPTPDPGQLRRAMLTADLGDCWCWPLSQALDRAVQHPPPKAACLSLGRGVQKTCQGVCGRHPRGVSVGHLWLGQQDVQDAPVDGLPGGTSAACPATMQCSRASAEQRLAALYEESSLTRLC